MKKLLTLILTIFICSCTSEQKNKLRKAESNKKLAEVTSEAVKSDIVLDTLVFDKNMIGELLNEKYALGLEELSFYKQFVTANKTPKKQRIDQEYETLEISYLGELKDLNQKDSYHVIANFTVIKDMQSPRGISKIAFLSGNLDKAIVYHMNMPDELPEKIEDNILYFTLESQKVGVSISRGLPPMLCLPKIGCY